MKRKHIYWIYLLLFLALISFSAFKLNHTVFSSADVNYAISSPIVITSDLELIASSSSGDGSETHPYVISDFEIDASAGIGISISSTTLHFLITNCQITSGTYGIYISNVASGTANVVNNECNFHIIDGIYVELSPGANITGNNVSFNTERAVRIIDCSNSIIDNNVGNYCGRSALNIQYSNYVNITNNHCEGNLLSGIFLRESLNSRIANNIIIDNYNYGIFPRDSPYGNITNNILINCGFYVGEDTLNDLFSYNIEGNTINGKEFGWYENLTNVILDTTDVGQMVLVNCSDVEVKNHDISYSSTGLTLHFCTDIDVSNNVFNHHTKTGLEVIRSSNINIYDNEISFSHERGVRLHYSDYIKFFDNLCSFSQTDGLNLYYSDNNRIYNNLFESNIGYGSLITDLSTNNHIYCNSFVNNSISNPSQGYDGVSGNLWLNTSTSLGNFWSDYSGSGTYSIDGSAGALDLYPNLCDLSYDDVYEDNDNFGSAAMLLIEEVYSMRAFDNDYFKIYLDEEMSYNILLSYDSSNINLDLFLYDENEDLLDYSNNAFTIDEILNCICDISGNYYIVVEISDGHKGLPYQIEIASFETPVVQTYSDSIFFSLLTILSISIVLMRKRKI